MSTAIRLSDSLVEDAKKYALINFRTVPKQIEYWTMLGRAAEDNPDLPLSLIKDMLLGLEEIKEGKVSPFSFDD